MSGKKKAAIATVGSSSNSNAKKRAASEAFEKDDAEDDNNKNECVICFEEMKVKGTLDSCVSNPHPVAANMWGPFCRLYNVVSCEAGT